MVGKMKVKDSEARAKAGNESLVLHKCCVLQMLSHFSLLKEKTINQERNAVIFLLGNKSCLCSPKLIDSGKKQS